MSQIGCGASSLQPFFAASDRLWRYTDHPASVVLRGAPDLQLPSCSVRNERKQRSGEFVKSIFIERLLDNVTFET